MYSDCISLPSIQMKVLHIKVIGLHIKYETGFDIGTEYYYIRVNHLSFVCVLNLYKTHTDLSIVENVASLHANHSHGNTFIMITL